MNGFIIPLIELVFIGGIIIFVGFFVFGGINNAWQKSWKWIWKYKIMKKPYPETILSWCLDSFDRDLDYYDIKKLLLIKNPDQSYVDEVSWIYLQVMDQLNKNGGKNGRKLTSSNKSVKGSELPSI